MSRRTRVDERAAVLEKARELARTEPSPDWTEEEWRKLMAAAVSQELERRPSGRRAFPQPLLAYGSAALLLVVVAAGVAVRLGVFKAEPRAPAQAPTEVVVQKSSAAPPSNEARAREREAVLAESPSLARKAEALVVGGIMPPAAARFEAKDEVQRPAGGDQGTVTIRLISPETGLRVVWVLDRNFEWKGETR